MSANDYINLNPRINTQALLWITVNPYSTQTNKLAELDIPENWPDFSAEELDETFCYLASKPHCNGSINGVSFVFLNDSDRLMKLYKNSQLVQTYNTNKALDFLQFENTHGQKIAISQTNQDQWVILVDDQSLLWDITKSSLCYQDVCISSEQSETINL